MIDYYDHDEPLKVNLKPLFEKHPLRKTGDPIKNYVAALDQNQFKRKDAWYSFYETPIQVDFLTFASEKLKI